MAIHLSDRDLIGFEAASRALLTPLDHPSTSAWRAEVTRMVRQLMGTDSVTFIMRDPGEPLLVADGLFDPEVLADYARHWYHQVLGDEVRIERKLGVWVREAVWPFCDVQRTAYYRDFCLPNLNLDSAGAAINMEGGEEVAMYLHSGTAGRFQPNGREVALLRLLRPALEAGAKAAQAFGAVRRDWRMLDVLPVPAGIFARNGCLLHATPKLTALFDANGLGSPLRAKAQSMVRQFIDGSARHPLRVSSQTESIDTVAGRFVLHLTYVERSVLGPGDLLVMTVTEPPRTLHPDALIARFRLTRREAEVAIMMSRGDRNREIARALGTSIHTVRRQVEQVLSKLDVSSRAAVAARIA